MAKFDAELYQKYRNDYPIALFEPLKSLLGPMKTRPRVLDLGAGTGISSLSFSRFYPEADFILVEPDLEMLEQSHQTLSVVESVQRIHESAERFQLEEKVDLVLIGSAWHWMNPAVTIERIQNVLKPGGAVFVFEYQFPKAKVPEHLPLNEWIRREFNLRWKPQGQTPRGSLRELTEPLRVLPGLSETRAISFEKSESFSLERFYGELLSQSRYLAYERTLNLEGREELRKGLLKELAHFWGHLECIPCTYWLEAFCFRRSNL